MPDRVALPPHEICPPEKSPSGQVPRLSIADLQPADIVLSYTEADVSWWVRTIEEGCYSHAALFDGQDHVIEAKGPGYGVVRSLLRDKPYQYADVFRYRWTSPPAPHDLRAVVDAAGTLLGKEFGVGNAILVGLLALTRRIDLPGGLEDSLRKVLDGAASLLTELGRDGRDFIICSELIYRAYAEAGHRIDIGPLHPRTPEAIRKLLREQDAVAKGAHAAELRAQLGRIAESYLGLRDRHRAALAGEKRADAVPDFITPLDLQISPSLKRVGRLDLGSDRASPARPEATAP